MPARTRWSLLVLVLAIGFCTQPQTANAFVRFDFDQRYLIQPGFIIKDHSLIRADDGTYHIFYIKADETLEEGDRAKALGHATSADLIKWTFHPDVIPVVADTWEESFIWAPHVVRVGPAASNPNAAPTYYMYYTGVNRYYSQATGLAVSVDLFNWYKSAGNPVYTPDPAWAKWDTISWSNCRDPFVIRDAGTWYMLNTAHTTDFKGAISLASSINLVDWTDEGPLMVHPGPNPWHVFESASLHKVKGAYHLFFTEEGVGGTSYLQSNTLLGPWDYGTVQPFDAGHATELLQVDNQWILSRHDAMDFMGQPIYSVKIDFTTWATPSKPTLQSVGPLDTWSTFGDAFDVQPTFWDNTLARGEDPSNFAGNSWIGSYESFNGPLQTGEPGDFNGDAATGFLRSPNFTLTGNRISFRLAGANDISRVFLALINADDGTLLRKTTGDGICETMSDYVWSASSPWIGANVFLLVADSSVDPGGHINVDEIVEYFEVPSSTELDSRSPGAVTLHQNAPNPFNPQTTIRFHIAQAGPTQLDILDVRGRLVRSLWNGALTAGSHEMAWNGRDDRGQPQSSGVYFTRLRLGDTPPTTRAMVLLK